MGKKRYGVELHPLYLTWLSMKTRCCNPNHVKYAYYGGRGITVCERWKDSFDAFKDDMGTKPPGYTLERIDNDLGYSPDNCKWASRKEQSNNKRARKAEFMLTIDGVTQSMRQWALELGIPLSSAYREYRKTRGLEKFLKNKQEVS